MDIFSETDSISTQCWYNVTYNFHIIIERREAKGSLAEHDACSHIEKGYKISIIFLKRGGVPPDSIHEWGDLTINIACVDAGICHTFLHLTCWLN